MTSGRDSHGAKWSAFMSDMVKRPILMGVLEKLSHMCATPSCRAMATVCSLKVDPLAYAGHGAVEAGIRRCAAKVIGIVIGQADHGYDLAGVHVHDDGTRPDGLERVHGGLKFVMHHVLHAHIHRQAQRCAVAVQPFVEKPFDARHAMIVNVHATEDLGGHAAHGVAAALARFEIDARNTQVVDRQFLCREMSRAR